MQYEKAGMVLCLLLPGARKKERIMQKTEKFRQKSQFLKI